MTATTDFIAQLIRAANEVGKLRNYERRRLMDRAVHTVKEMRADIGIRPSYSTNDALLEIEVSVVRSEGSDDDTARRMLLDLT